jgi:hypothetical protein
VKYTLLCPLTVDVICNCQQIQLIICPGKCGKNKIILGNKFIKERLKIKLITFPFWILSVYGSLPE